MLLKRRQVSDQLGWQGNPSDTSSNWMSCNIIPSIITNEILDKINFMATILEE